MEKSSSDGQLIVLTKGNWLMKTQGDYTFRDNSVKGTVDIHAMRLANESLVSQFRFLQSSNKSFTSNNNIPAHLIHIIMHHINFQINL